MAEAMEDEDYRLPKADLEKIREAVRHHAPIEITTYTLPRNMEIYIQQVVVFFLKECHQEHMIDYLKFCLGELLTNSKKANTKRIYFSERQLDINNPEDYAKGMKSFKDDTFASIDYYLEKQKKAGLYVKLVIQLFDDHISLEIKNNSLATRIEMGRIQEKLDMAQKYESINSAMTDMIDQTEGAGLGIIIIVLMLKKIGLSHKNFQFFIEGEESVTKIVLPLNSEVQDQISTLTNDYLDRFNKIPVMQESLDRLVEHLGRGGEDSLELAAAIISVDASLTALLLIEACKIKEGCCSIPQAMRLLGAARMLQFFSPENPDIRVVPSLPPLEAFFESNERVATNAYNLALNFVKEDLQPEDFYTTALLRNVFQLLLHSGGRQGQEFVSERARSMNASEAVENLFFNDNNHCTGSMLLCRRWGLPEGIAVVNGCLDEPESAPEDYRLITYIVYLANAMRLYELNQLEFYQINEAVLRKFNINDEKTLGYLISEISSVL